jgi:hypothetical protein
MTYYFLKSVDISHQNLSIGAVLNSNKSAIKIIRQASLVHPAHFYESTD